MAELGELFYQVKWKDFEELSWEPAANLNHLRKMITKFSQALHVAMSARASPSKEHHQSLDSETGAEKKRLKKQSSLLAPESLQDEGDYVPVESQEEIVDVDA